MSSPPLDPKTSSALVNASASLSFPVRSYECGPEGRAGLSTLANYFQEAAGHHARLLGVSMERLMEDDLAWVLRRMRVEIVRLPERGEVVAVETWPLRFGRLVAERHFVALDESGAVIARAASEWVIVDMTRRRVARVPDQVRRLRPETDRRACELPSRSLAVLEKEVAGEPEVHRAAHFEARRSALDIVGHVNNSQYLRWIVDALPEVWWQQWRPKAFEIHYLAECSAGEILTVCSWRLAEADDGSVSLLHRVEDAGVVEQDDGGTARRTLAATEWQRKT